MSVSKVRNIKQNADGKAVTANSIVKFKTYPSSSPQDQLTHSGSINQNIFSPQITSLLLSMKKGDIIQFQTNQQPPSNSPFIIDNLTVIELIQVKDGQQFIDNYKKAESLKNQGNEQIKLKNYQKAAQFYQQGLRLIEYQCSPQAQTVKISLLSNLTLAYLNTLKYQNCIQTCQKYLQNSLQPNKKIIYRKASANKNLRKWEQAQNDIRFGLQICENDEEGKKDFYALQQAMKKDKKLQSEKQKKVYSRMFG